MTLTADDIARLFTRPDGGFLFARWGRPMAPVVFGVDDRTLSAFKGALTAVAGLTGRPLAETDPELGANLMVFFLREWEELAEVPDLDRLIPELGALMPRLAAAGANQYRLFRFDAAGAIRAAFVFLRLDADLAATPLDALALSQAVQVALLWGGGALAARPVLVAVPGGTALDPAIARLIAAAHDPVLPDMSRDPALALRLAARILR